MPVKKSLTILFITLLFLLAGSMASAQPAKSKSPLTTRVDVYRLTNVEQQESDIKAPLLLTIALDMIPDWYTYAQDPGGMGKPTKLTGTTANGASVTTIYPKGIRKPDSYDSSVMVNVYKSGTRLFVLIPDAGDTPFPLSLRLSLLLCHPTKCVPARRDLTIQQPEIALEALPLASEQTWWPEILELTRKHSTTRPRTTPSLSDGIAPQLITWNFTPKYLQPGLEVASLFSAILMGLLAGLILNVMPCVLPVVSLKLSALLNSSAMEKKEDRIAAFREHNIFFALGILSFFLLLAIILGGTGSAWGALFQHQWLVLTIAAIIMVLSLSLFGLFYLPVIDLKFANENKNPRVQAFFTGNLTTLLATPCSGPFLGGVLSWALVQGPIVIATVFISIGIGMAFPYLVLVINPGLSRYLPKSGPWIEYVEKGIAFFLVGTSFYLVSIALGSESLRILAPLWALLLGGWLWHQTRHVSLRTRWIIRLSSLILLIGLVAWTTPNHIDESVWEEFNATELQRAIGKKPIFVDFTADWCPTCKVLEATVLTPKNVARWKKQYGVTFIKADMTDRNLEAEDLLRSLGSMSIPTAALFIPGPESMSPLVLRDLFTQSQLENILKSWEK